MFQGALLFYIRRVKPIIVNSFMAKKILRHFMEKDFAS